MRFDRVRVVRAHRGPDRERRADEDPAPDRLAGVAHRDLPLGVRVSKIGKFLQNFAIF